MSVFMTVECLTTWLLVIYFAPTPNICFRLSVDYRHDSKIKMNILSRGHPYNPPEFTFQPFVSITLQGVWCEQKISHVMLRPFSPLAISSTPSFPDFFQVLLHGIYQCTPAYSRHRWTVHHIFGLFACIVWRDITPEVEIDIHPQWCGGMDCKERVIAGPTCPIHPVLLPVCHALIHPVLFLCHQRHGRKHGMSLETWWLELLTLQCQHSKGLLLLIILTCTLLPK